MTWLVDTLLVTGLLIALVLLVRGPVARLFGPGLAYALWVLPVLRLLVPPLTLPAEPVAVAPAVVTMLASPVPGATAPAPAWTFAPLLQAVWLGGALAYLVWRAWQYRAMRRSLLAGAVSAGEAGAVRLVESPAAASPVAFGVFDKVVAVPPAFMALTPRRERDLAIAHELEHHRGRDLAINIALQPLLALHWFNPLGWAAWRALRRDQEAACDARVLAGQEPATRAVYGRLIASFAAARNPALASPLACPILHEKSIVHRLRSLTMTQPSHSRRLAGRLLFGVAALAVPLTATITYAAAEPEPPAAPTPPAPPAPAEVRKVQKVVIVEAPDGAASEDTDLHTRTVERNGKTIVLKTRQPLTDAEAEARIAKAEASMGQGEDFAWASADSGEGAAANAKVTRKVVVVRHGDGPHGDHAKGENREVHTMVFRHDGAGGAKAMAHGEGGAAMAHCTSGKPVTAVVDRSSQGKQHKSIVMVCAKPGDKGAAVAGLRSAREKVAADPNLPADVKSEVLKQLDAEIEKTAKAG